MIVYLINRETNELINEYTNVIRWGYNFVEYNNGGRCKIYCGDNEYFTDEYDSNLTEDQQIETK